MRTFTNWMVSVPEDGKVTVVAHRKDAERVRKKIIESNIFDQERSIGRGEKVHFPVILPDDRGPGWLKDILGEVTVIPGRGDTTDRKPSSSPYQTIRAMLSNILDEEGLRCLPEKWERVGDCLVLRLQEELKDRGKEIGEAYGKVLGSRYVLMDQGGVKGEFRRPEMKLLVPPPDGIRDVLHGEGNCRYHLDPGRIMFSSGNTDLRVRFPSIITSTGPVHGPEGEDGTGRFEHEVILDMFAGIGYFSIPVARSLSPRKVIAVEKNSVAFAYLKRNIIENGVEDIVEPLLGDNRDISPNRDVDRVMMGYVGGTVDFLPTALSSLVEKGGRIHLQDTVKVEEGVDVLFRKACSIAGKNGFDLVLLDSRKVKSFAPRIDHVMLDIDVLPTP